MASNRLANIGILLICMLAGLTVGNFIGEVCNKIPYLTWLSYQGNFGLNSPMQIDLGAVWLSLQVKFTITLAGVLGMLLGIWTYKKL